MAGCLVLVRHASIDSALAGRLVGQSDPPLDPRGLVQARQLADTLARYAPARCYCSPKTRCRQTVEAAGLACHVQLDDDLREIDFGRWENRAFDEIAAEEPAAVAAWGSWQDGFAFPGGEGIDGFLQRVRRAADRLAHDDSPTVAAVTHGGVIRAMLCHLLAMDPRHYVAFEPAYAAVIPIRLFGGRGVLRFPGPEAVPQEVCHG